MLLSLFRTYLNDIDTVLDGTISHTGPFEDSVSGFLLDDALGHPDIHSFQFRIP